MFFKISGGEFPGCPPVLAGLPARVCAITIPHNRSYVYWYTVSGERSRVPLPYVFWWNWCCLHPVNTVNMHLVDFLVCVCDQAEMKTSTETTEILCLCRNQNHCTPQVSGNALQKVEKFKYLGVVFTSDRRRNKDICIRIG